VSTMTHANAIVLLPTYLPSTFEFLHEILNAAVEKRKPDKSPFDLPCWEKAKETFDDQLDSEGFAIARWSGEVSQMKQMIQQFDGIDLEVRQPRR
jgi:hypothetical protein